MNDTDFRDVRMKIRDGYYDVTTTIKYPKPPNKPLLPQEHTSEELKQYTNELEKYETKQEIYKHRLKTYNKLKVEKMQLFMKEALEECGLTGHPRADKAYSYAWEEGHSAGIAEVLSHLEEIADVLIG